jgi:hypothetical protein
LSDPSQQISQGVSGENHPPIDNPAPTNNVATRKHSGKLRPHSRQITPSF